MFSSGGLKIKSTRALLDIVLRALEWVPGWPVGWYGRTNQHLISSAFDDAMPPDLFL